jgi:hypothetical protein
LIISAALNIGPPPLHSLFDVDFGVVRDFFSSGDEPLLDDDRLSPANVLNRSNRLASLTWRILLLLDCWSLYERDGENSFTKKITKITLRIIGREG